MVPDLLVDVCWCQLSLKICQFALLFRTLDYASLGFARVHFGLKLNSDLPRFLQTGLFSQGYTVMR